LDCDGKRSATPLLARSVTDHHSRETLKSFGTFSRSTLNRQIGSIWTGRAVLSNHRAEHHGYYFEHFGSIARIAPEMI